MSTFATLLALVRSRSTAAGLLFHGEDHWREVAAIGLEFANQTAGCDRQVVLLFALFHDSMRIDDDADRDHGRRAAALVTELALPTLGVEARQSAMLALACREHTDGKLSDDPTIGVCWDADRLTLRRVGIEPHPRYFSTAAGRRRLGLALASDVPDWPDLAERAAVP